MIGAVTNVNITPPTKLEAEVDITYVLPSGGGGGGGDRPYVEWSIRNRSAYSLTEDVVENNLPKCLKNKKKGQFKHSNNVTIHIYTIIVIAQKLTTHSNWIFQITDIISVLCNLNSQ